MKALANAPTRLFQIEYVNGKRYVHCDYCNKSAERSIVTHLKQEHPREWKEFIQVFSRLRREGYSYKKIMWQFGRAFSWTVIERELAEAGVLAPPVRKKSVTLGPNSFEEQLSTLWTFKNRGDWAVHDSMYRGNWAPEVPRNLILKYSREGDWVLDPFIGGGTTAIECFLLRRNCIGFDVNPAAISLGRRKLRTLKRKAKGGIHLLNGHSTIRLHNNDARNMHRVPSSSIQLVCAHPPYLDIVEYTRKDPADFSTITDPDRYVRELRKISYEVFRCLKPGGIFCILIGDVRRSARFIPLGFKVLSALLESFDLQEIVIKTQHQCSATPFYKSKKHRFLRIAHEYLFVLKKSADSVQSP